MSAHRYSFGSLLSLALASLIVGVQSSIDLQSAIDVTIVCQKIEDQISNQSGVIYPLDLVTYQSDISHWFLTSTQEPACILQAGSAEDVSTAIKTIGQTRTPFAVYSGGHASNPGFSSTTGVHISFENMKQVVVSSDSKTVEIGMGNTWVDVYQALDGTGVNVVGGRTQGPGVGGFTLGGDYSWLTNQYRLTCDNVKTYNLILPNGTLTQVTSEQKDLFFALKGGLDRFGIVTSIVYNAVPQTPTVHGGFKISPPRHTTELVAATQQFFHTNTDPKAQSMTTLDGSLTNVSALILSFYDGPEDPASFKPFDAYPTILDEVKAQSFFSFVSRIPAKLALNARGTFNTLYTTSLTPKFLNAVQKEIEHYGTIGIGHSATTVSVDIEPFLPGWSNHSMGGAYPHDDSSLPLNLYFAWLLPEDDEFWFKPLCDLVTRLKAVAVSEGISTNETPAYPNYAITGTSATALYGSQNAARLAKIRN